MIQDKECEPSPEPPLGLTAVGAVQGRVHLGIEAGCKMTLASSAAEKVRARSAPSPSSLGA